MADLAVVTSYQFFPEPVEGYATVYRHSRSKQALAFSDFSSATVGRIRGMTPLYRALCQIF